MTLCADDLFTFMQQLTLCADRRSYTFERVLNSVIFAYCASLNNLLVLLVQNTFYFKVVRYATEMTTVF